MQLGWSEPRFYSMRSGGSVVLPAANRVKPDAPVILYDPARGTNEYFILELEPRRRRAVWRLSVCGAARSSQIPPR